MYAIETAPDTGLKHIWSGDTPKHRCQDEGYCAVHDGGIDCCSVYGCDDQGGSTTHRPGERVPTIMSTLVYYGPLDYVDGNWVYANTRNNGVTYGSPPSLDHFVENADRRCEKQRDISARGAWKDRTERLTVSIRRA
jgi:hypothetical protein